MKNVSNQSFIYIVCVWNSSFLSWVYGSQRKSWIHTILACWCENIWGYSRGKIPLMSMSLNTRYLKGSLRFEVKHKLKYDLGSLNHIDICLLCRTSELEINNDSTMWRLNERNPANRIIVFLVAKEARIKNESQSSWDIHCICVFLNGWWNMCSPRPQSCKHLYISLILHV